MSHVDRSFAHCTIDWLPDFPALARRRRLTMMGYEDRRARRGAMSQDEFVRSMWALGFREVTPAKGVIWEFVHSDTGERRYIARDPDPLGELLQRFQREHRRATAL